MSTSDPIAETTTADKAVTTSESFSSKFDGWLERVVDRANPILVKEVRQAMKGRGFVGTFLLLVGACWLISVLGALNAGASMEYFDWAQTFFCWFFIPLTFAIGLVVPFLAYSSMQNERLDDTFEMLSITTLTARRIVNGKLTNALVLILLCFSGIAPFIAFTSLLQGFRLLPVLLAMTIAVFMSIGFCVIAIFISTLSRKNRLIQALLSLGLIFILLLGCSSVQLLFLPEFWTIPARWEIWAVFGIAGLSIICIIFLVREMAIAQITFESDNRTTGVRLVTSIIFILTLTILSLFFYWPTLTGSGSAIPPYARLEVLETFAVPLMLFIFAVGYFSCTEAPGMSRRVRKQVQRRNGLLRIFSNPWLPGCYRGYLYTGASLLIITAYILVISKTTSLGPSGSGFPTPSYTRIKTLAVIVAAICLYGLVYAGFACALSSALHRRFGKGMTTTVVRAIFVAIIGGLAIIPHFVTLAISEFGTGRPISYTVGMVTSPMATFFEIGSTSGNDSQVNAALMVLGIAASLLFFFNLRGIGRSYVEINSTDQQSPVPSPPTDSAPFKPEAA